MLSVRALPDGIFCICPCLYCSWTERVRGQSKYKAWRTRTCLHKLIQAWLAWNHSYSVRTTDEQWETTTSTNDSLQLRRFLKWELLLKERICSQRDRILSFKSSSLRYGKSPLPHTVSFLGCYYFYYAQWYGSYANDEWILWLKRFTYVCWWAL